MHLKIALVISVCSMAGIRCAMAWPTCSSGLKPINGLKYLKSSHQPLPAGLIACLRPMDAYAGQLSKALRATGVKEVAEIVACTDWAVPELKKLRTLAERFNDQDVAKKQSELVTLKAEHKSKIGEYSNDRTIPKRALGVLKDEYQEGEAAAERRVSQSKAYAFFTKCAMVFYIDTHR